MGKELDPVMCLLLLGPGPLSRGFEKAKGKGNTGTDLASQGQCTRPCGHRVHGSVLPLSPYLCFLSLLSSATQGKLHLINYPNGFRKWLVSGMLPPVKENIYICSPFAYLDEEGEQRAGMVGSGRPAAMPRAGGALRAAQKSCGSPGTRTFCFPTACGQPWGCSTYRGFLGRQLPPLPRVTH